jgi:ATP-dependent RNA helicase DeaD
MNGRGYRAEALHGGMDQEQRDRVMGRLRSGAAELLVATDVAARGLDVDLLTHVVNYEVPSSPEAYVHRIGRVGRAGREGVAITLAEPREQRLLENIERLTKQKISIEKIPSVADLRAKQMELTIESVSTALTTDGLDQFAPVIAKLSDHHSLEQIALAAIKLAHEASGATLDEVEIPDIAMKRDRPAKPKFDSGPRAKSGFQPGSDRTARIYVGAGRSSGVRPQDLVGAIANETKLSGRDIGAIRVSDHYSIVEIPDEAVDDVVASMARTTIKGRKATVRRYRDEKP